MLHVRRQPSGIAFEIRLADLTLAEGEASGWALATALPWTLDEGVPVMRARDVQHVMDAPWVASPKLWHDSYREQGVDFHVWVHDTLPADPARFMSEHVAFTRAQLSYFGSFPTEEYHFLYLFPDRDVRHGVEHEDSTVIALGPAERVKSEEGHMEIIGIASHELYHAWNVKRIRPAEWTPYDFTQACPSELGYIAEGVTTYMGDLFLFEAGVVDLEGWCGLMTKAPRAPPEQPGQAQHERRRLELRHLAGRVPARRPWTQGQHLRRRRRLGVLVRLPHHGFDGRPSLAEHRDAVAVGTLWTPSNGTDDSDYWNVLAEVAGEPLDDLRRHHAEGTEDTWQPLVDAMATQGLELSKRVDDKGLTRVSLTPQNPPAPPMA